jgi:phenylalanyl-tRNA synthetase beta chain
MKISTNTLRSITEKYNAVKGLLPNSIEELTNKIGAQLGAIETVENFGKKYEGVIVARVVTCVDHPNADRLHVCTIDDGGITPDVKRDENGYIQVVCGAPNVREGLLVAWLPPGSTVPDSFDKDPFVLGSRELRGVVSNGMLASPKELAISDAHEGILELDGEIQPGTSFAEAFDLVDDSVIDIENKMFTHRPDCFGWLGVAREIAGIQGKPFVSPSWYMNGTPSVYEVKSDIELPLTIKNELPELVPRFVAGTLSNIQIKPSPVWLQLQLARHGVRPINNVVDITNLLMLETGQPMHAYDYDKVRALDGDAKTATIAVRLPKNDEKLELLSGKTITPNEKAILIATASTAIGLGGVMGGGDTEVSADTTNIILECASFDMYSIRRTAMANGVFTDAVTRFTKGQSPLQNKQIAEKAIEMLEKYADAKFVAIYDNDHTDKKLAVVQVTSVFINERLGLSLTSQEMKTLLENVEFTVGNKSDVLSVTAPFWRTDIAIPEDIVEEIGRLYGFDKLPLELPARSLTPAQKDKALTTKSRVREILSRAGANEVLTYSFVHGNLLKKVGQNPEDAFSLSNALSPDLQYFRLSITPSLLEKIHPNIKAGYGEFALFEIGKGHAVKLVDEDGIPREWTNIALTYTADDKSAKAKAGAAFYEARAFAVQLLDSLGVTYEIEPVNFELTMLNDQLNAAPFDKKRLAYVRIHNKVAGFIGEYSTSVHSGFKLPNYSAGFEIWFDELVKAQTNQAHYRPLSRFPKIEQDITLSVPISVNYLKLHTIINEELKNIVPLETTWNLSARDIYQPDGSNIKNVTFRFTISSYETTLTDYAVNEILDTVSAVAGSALGASRI